MIRVFVVLVPFMTLVFCSEEPPPSAPAGKASDFDVFQSQSEDQQSSAEPDTTKSQAEPDSASTFDIELIFLDEFTASEKQIMAELAAAWEDRLDDISDYRIRKSDNTNCGYNPIRLERGRIIDDVIVYVAKQPNGMGSASVMLERRKIWRNQPQLPAVGCITIGDWLDGPLETPEHKAFVQDIFLDGLNHVLDAFKDVVQDPVVVQPDDGTFDIELIFLDEFTASEKQVMADLVAYWEDRLDDIPAYRLITSAYSGCGDHPITLKKGRIIDDVIVYVAKFPNDDPNTTSSSYNRILDRPGNQPQLPAVGCIEMSDWLRPLGTPEHKTFVRDVFLEGLNHVLDAFKDVVQDPVDVVQDPVDVVQDPVVVQPDDDTFDIELIFLDEFTASEKQIMAEETAYWEDRLDDIPRYRLTDPHQNNCGNHPITLEKGRVIDDVIIYVAKLPNDDPNVTFSSYGRMLDRPGNQPQLPAVGCIEMSDWLRPLGTPQHETFVLTVFLEGLDYVLDAFKDVVQDPVDVAQDPVVDLPDDDTFDIELIFLDEFTASEKQIMAELAAAWEDRLDDIPAYRLITSAYSGCGDHPITLERDRVIDDVIVYVAKFPKEQRLDGSDQGRVRYGVLMDRPTEDRLPATGCVMIADWKKAPLGTHEHKAFVQKSFLIALNSMLGVFEDVAQDPVVDLPDDDTFDIELIFLDEFDPLEKQIMVEEVGHWEKMLGDIPAYRFGYRPFFLSDCGDHSISLEKGRVVDDVIMYVAKLPKDEPDEVAGTAFIAHEREIQGRLPAVGCVMINEWKSGPWGTPEHKAFVQDVFLHEMGHALGIGVGYNWSRFVVWEEDGSGVRRAHFAGPSAIAAYDGLPRLIGPDPDAPLGPLGGPSRALVAQPGGVLYTGNKVPLLGSGHWGETIGGELVAYDPVVQIDSGPKLSTVSLGALEDMGYPVRYENADPFWVELDAPAGKPTTSFFCGVGQGILNH